MSCLPCFGKKKDGNGDGGGDEQAESRAGGMTPPPAVHAPAPSHAPASGAPVAVAAPSQVTPTKPGGESDANPEDALRQTIEGRAFAFRELAAATDHFTPYNLVGEGGFFRVYKGQLEKNGQNVAIKQMDKHGFQGNMEFLTEVAKLSKLHQENLIELIGYCADGDQRLLVYEHMDCSGTLEDHLYDLPPEKTPMGWTTRMKVAYGAAQGLEYLHEKADPPVVYGDFKASHILLDATYTPKLSDFGLQQLGQSGGGNMPMASPMMGAFGCLAPEYDRGGQVSMKSDVYSFGVVLLQLISGRRTVDTSKPTEEQNVVTWAQPMFKDQKRYHELVDPVIKREYPSKALNQIVAMASMCLQEEDCVRPMMGDVVMTLGFLVDLPPDPPAPVVVPAPAAAPEPKKDDQSHHSRSSSSSSDDDDDHEEEEEEEEDEEHS